MSARDLDLDAVAWLLETKDAAGGVSYRLGKRGPNWIGEWGGCVWLEVTDEGRRVSLSNDGTVDPFFLAKVERGPVAALERRLRGELTLHASATSSPTGEGLLVLGESGAGKSTTAAALVRDRGHSLLADDIAWIDFEGDRAVIAPTEDHSYLSFAATSALGLTKVDDHVYWDDATKCGVPSRVAARAAPLGAIAIVAWSSDASMSMSMSTEKLSVLDAMRDILPHVSRCGITTPRARLAELDDLSRLLGSVFVYRVRRPKRFEALPEYLDTLTQLTPRFR